MSIATAARIDAIHVLSYVPNKLVNNFRPTGGEPAVTSLPEVPEEGYIVQHDVYPGLVATKKIINERRWSGVLCDRFWPPGARLHTATRVIDRFVVYREPRLYSRAPLAPFVRASGRWRSPRPYDGHG